MTAGLYCIDPSGEANIQPTSSLPNLPTSTPDLSKSTPSSKKSADSDSESDSEDEECETLFGKIKSNLDSIEKANVEYKNLVYMVAPIVPIVNYLQKFQVKLRK
jgi:hypothetical protein